MKKMLVVDSHLDDNTTTEISLFLSSHYAYGVVDFSVEKVAGEVARVFKLTPVEVSPPYVIFNDEQGREVVVKAVEENYE